MDVEPGALRGPVRNVTARELGRNVAGILNEIEHDGGSIMIIRYGRTAAMLTPAGDNLPVSRPHQAPDPRKVYESEIEALSELQKTILVNLGDGRTNLDPTVGVCDAREGQLEIVKMELRHLVTRDIGGITITRKGARVARALTS